jgi:hypothetical protein
VDDHVVTISYHPLGLLDRLSVPGGYSTRAAGASAAASDADMYLVHGFLRILEDAGTLAASAAGAVMRS